MKAVKSLARAACCMLWVTMAMVQLSFRWNIKLFDFCGGNGIKSGARLVEQKHFGIYRKGAGDAETLLLSAGEGKGGFFQVVLHFVPEGGAAQAVFDEIVEAAFVAIDAQAVRNVVVN